MNQSRFQDLHREGFLVFLLHLQAAYGGGMSCSASASVPAETVSVLDANGRFAGAVNGMRACSRNGQVVCFLKRVDLLSKGETRRVFAGATREAGLDAIASALPLDREYRHTEPKRTH